ncbi:nucleotidyltransferase family protein [Lysinibacillus sp. FSL K6-3209]|uniref:nucleotidyltransferase family protein n=1 Tax=Lysinibacillus sp. FSL K6-3209 TaxID=2921497 RepID=UPI0030DCA5C2
MLKEKIDLYKACINETTGLNKKFSFNCISENKLIDQLIYSSYNIKDLDNENRKYLIKKRELRLKEIKNVIRVLNKQERKFIIIKGISIQKYYPNNIKRQFHDLDIVVKEFDEFCDILKILLELGYKYKFTPAICQRENEIFGVVEVYKELNDNIKNFIELNCGGFPVSYYSWLNFKHLWEQKQHYSFEGLNFYMPSDTMNLLILVAEAGGNHKLRVRDFIDYRYLLNTNIDWNLFRYHIKRLHLKKDYKDLKTLYLKLESFNNKSKIRNLSSWERKRNIYRFFYHDMIHVIKHPRRLKLIFFILLESIADSLLENDKIIDFFLKSQRVFKPRIKFESGGIINTVYLNSLLKVEFEVWEENNYLLIGTPLGVFLGTIFGIYEDELDEINKIFSEKYKERNE